MGNKNGEQVGLALLGSISAFSVWSAINPSIFTVSAFRTSEQVPNIRLGMNVGVILVVVLALGIYFAYGKKATMPAMITGLTGVGLWFSYDYLIKKEGKVMSITSSS